MNRLVLPKNYLFSLWHTLELNRLSDRFNIIINATYLIVYMLQIMSLRDMAVITLPITIKLTGFIVLVCYLIFIILQATVYLISERHCYL